jgi:predicted dehydrogenase
MATATLKGVGVGAGYFSAYQYEAWRRIPEVAMTAICNRTVAKAEAMAARYDIPRVYGDFDEMIEREKPDFVDIITPPQTHLDYCTRLAGRGISMICQKPLAPTWDECVRLVETVEKSPARFVVHENWRWQPWYREMKRLLDSGLPGELFSINVRMRMGDGWGADAYLSRQPFFRDYPRLLIYETGVHFLDTFRFLGGEITSVYARLRRLNPAIKGEDAGMVVCGMANGSTAVLDANRYNEAATDEPRYTFGTVRIDGSRGHLELGTDGAITVKPLGEPAYNHAYRHERRGFAGDCCYHFQRHVVDTLLGGGQFESSGADYLKTLRAVEACYQSAECGEVIRLPV